MTVERSIPLYRADNPFWLTDASIGHGGELVITSGTASNEYIIIVAADRKIALLDALLPHVSPASSNDSIDQQLLVALAARFAGDCNPFEDIEAFLHATNISLRRDVWLDGFS